MTVHIPSYPEVVDCFTTGAMGEYIEEDFDAWLAQRDQAIRERDVKSPIRQWLRDQAYSPDDIVLGSSGLEQDQLRDLYRLLDALDPDWREFRGTA